MIQLNIILFLTTLIACVYLLFEEEKYLVTVSEPFAPFGSYGIFFVLLIPFTAIFYNDLVSRYSEHFSYLALKASDLFRFILTILSGGISFGFIRLLRMETLNKDEITLNWFVKIRRRWSFDELKDYSKKWLEFKDISFSNRELNDLVHSNKTKSIKELDEILNLFVEKKSHMEVPSIWSAMFSNVTQLVINNISYILVGTFVFIVYWKFTSWLDFSFFGFFRDLFKKDPEPLNRTLASNSEAFVQISHAVDSHSSRISDLIKEVASLQSDFTAFASLFQCVGDQPGKRIKDLHDHVRNLASMIATDRRNFKFMFPFSLEEMSYFKPFMYHTIKSCMAVASASSLGRKFPGSGKLLGSDKSEVSNSYKDGGEC